MVSLEAVCMWVLMSLSAAGAVPGGGVSGLNWNGAMLAKHRDKPEIPASTADKQGRAISRSG